MTRIFFKIKICSEQRYREDFLDGSLYMNTLGFFRSYEEATVGNVADRHEATISLLQPEQHTITLTRDDLPGWQHIITGIAGPTVLQSDYHSRLNVLCLYAAHERGHTFETDEHFECFVNAQMLAPEVDGLGGFAAIVFDTAAFQARVFDAIRRNDFSAVAGLVDYYDVSVFHGSFDQKQAVLKKRSEYSHQREYRFALDRETSEEAPYTLSVGSLRDIAIGCDTSEVNGLVRSYLYQLRAQGVFG